MRINKYKMLKNDMYEIIFEGYKYIIHSDLILKNNLLLRDDVTTEELTEIQLENQIYETYNIAIKLLNIKVRSYKELYDLLIKKGFDPEKIKVSLNLLIQQGYLSDKKYAMYFVHDQMLLSKYGPYKIRKNLIARGIKEEYIDEAIKIYDDETQKKKVEKLVSSFIKSNRTRSAFDLRQKTIAYLINNGYRKDIIVPYVDSIVDDDQEIYQHELNKITKSLSRKYSGDDLQRRIKQKMYSKGFNINNL